MTESLPGILDVSQEGPGSQGDDVSGGKFGTRNGYSMFECSSALQKSLRRGLVEEAMHWAVELELSGYGEYLWRRLKVVSVEDVGMADPQACVVVRALYENYKEMRPKKSKSERLMIAQAVTYLATSPKSRAMDHLNMVAFTEHEHAGQHAVPDWAYDMHTQKGRKMGRGIEHFFTESVQLAPVPLGPMHHVRQVIEAGGDPWVEEARDGKMAGKETADKPEGGYRKRDDR